MNFGQAYSAVEMGAAVRRASWNPGNVHVRLQRPDAHSLMTVPYLYIITYGADGAIARMPWIPDQRALAADDWDYYDPGAAT